MTTINEPLADARDMFAVHTMFRREFRLMPGLIRAVTAGDTRRATLVADHVALVSGVLNAHHSAEDQHIWPLLRERCPEECAPLIEVMEDQHHAIHTRLLQATEAARHVCQPSRRRAMPALPRWPAEGGCGWRGAGPP